eukprot:snap_masked-scaffold_7-processed-gene-12.3-mRNA-1 protein AED:1.00 eAED:1.00 QI:0/0/0/0/1/1/2/0/73
MQVQEQLLVADSARKLFLSVDVKSLFVPDKTQSNLKKNSKESFDRGKQRYLSLFLHPIFARMIRICLLQGYQD